MTCKWSSKASITAARDNLTRWRKQHLENKHHVYAETKIEATLAKVNAALPS